MKTFQKELEALINKHSMENGSNTPDFLLAEYLKGCLDVFNNIISRRSLWYGETKYEGPNESKELGKETP